MADMYLHNDQQSRPLSILNDDFSVKLSAFNDLTRDIRNAGIGIKYLLFLDNTIYIELPDVELFLRRFGHELRNARHTPAERLTRITVGMRGIDVAWYSLVKEQDQ